MTAYEYERIETPEHLGDDDLRASAQRRLEHVRRLLSEKGVDVKRTVRKRGGSAYARVCSFCSQHPVELVAGLALLSYVAGKLIGDRVLKDD